DQDCDGRVDETPTGPGAATYYRDGDRDGSGDASRPLVACIPPADHVVTSGDCDDTRSDVRPGMAELCDGLDQNCDGSVDDGGACTPTCPSGQIACGTRCVDPMTDLAYCGASGSCAGIDSGTACGPGQLCSMGTCAPTCDAALALCDGRCRDLSNDPMYCGDCTGACLSGPNAAPVCVAGGCRIFCEPSFGDCDANAGTGCEADLLSSPMHCGRCGGTCPGEPDATRACAAGACGALTCDVGFQDCDGDLGTGGNGCETSGASCPRVLWATTWGDANDDWNTGSGRDFELTADAAGNLYAVGSYGGDITVAGTSYSAARFAGIVVSLTPTGAIRWASHVRTSTTGDALPNRIVFDPTTGDVIIAGTGWGSEVLVGATSIGPQNSNCTAFLARLSAASGAPVWGRTYPNASCSFARGLTSTPVGDLAVAGSFTGTHVMDGFSVANPTGVQDGWVAFVDPGTGTTNGLFRFGSAAGDEQVYGIAGYGDGDVVVVGTYNTADADIGGRPLTWGGNTDAFHARFTRAGSSVHASGIRTASAEQLNDVVIGPSGDYYLAGYYDSSTTVGATTLSGSSLGTILARAGASDGGYAWVTGNAGGGNAPYGIRRIVVDAAGTVRVAWVTSAGPTSTFAGVSMPTTGGNVRVARVDGATGAAIRIESFAGAGVMSSNAIALLPDGRVATGGNFSSSGSVDGVSLTNAGSGYDHYVMLLGPGI
ncbi:MAG: MopE-related protein, partial [Actinomycetota bacterium]|nr:MopE-related protein [Actinomycetota bacterium]